jgi:hypothetical protein
MATTYAALQTEIAAFLNRTDMTAIIPTFIALAEAQLARDVRHWRMQERAALTIDSRYETLPADWVETIRLTIDADEKPLRLIALAEMQDMRAYVADVSGVPTHYAHIGGEIEFYPTPEDSHTGEILYYQTIPALATASTNWLLDQAPDAYLYGSLIHSAPYLLDDARAATWGALYAAAVQRLNQTSDAARWSGTGLRMRAPR